MSGKENAEAFLIIVKRLAKWMALGIAGLVVAGILLWAGVLAYEWWSERPYKLTEYEGVKLGASQSEVQYAKGAPSSVLLVEGKGEPGKPWTYDWSVVDVAKLEKGKSVEDYLMWSYAIGRDKRLDISFDQKEKKVSSISCYSDSYLECEKIFGIHDGSSEKELLGKLGVPEKEEITQATKRMDFEKFNVRFYLSKLKVYMITVGMS
jgi:hypothetical protein